MSRESPQAAFEHARAAMARGDLPGVFACLDVNDLKRAAENAVALTIMAQTESPDEEVRRVCSAHGFPLDDILASWRHAMATPGMEASMAYRAAMKSGLAAVTNLPAFLAGLEGYSRRTTGGGSISMRLFQQEQLTDVQEYGSRAWGTRVLGPGSSDDVEFVKRKGEWFIKLITRSRP